METKGSEELFPLDKAGMINEDPAPATSPDAGDSNFATAPSSPATSPHRMINNTESYQTAVQNPDSMWEWHTGDNTGPVSPADIPRSPPLPLPFKPSDRSVGQSPPLPLHIESPRHVASDPRHIGAAVSRGDPHATSRAYHPASRPEVISSNPVHVQVGFNAPAVSPMNTTTLSSLPGQQTITSPPHSSKTAKGSIVKARSIEEIDRKNYAPDYTATPTANFSPDADSGSTAFCIDLASSMLGYRAPFEGGDKMKSVGLLSERPGSGKERSFSVELELLHESDESSETSSTTSSKSNCEDLFADFLKSQTCYDIIPPSGKIVVFDTRLRVKKAFFALVANGVRSAPVWDSASHQFVGMLTITDFIYILRQYYKSPIVGMDELEEQTIQTWRETVANVRTSLVQIHPTQSLFEAAKMLLEYKIHRLPVIDRRTGNSFYILTHKRLLHYMYYTLLDEQQPSYMQKSLKSLGIGSYRSIATATQDTPIIVALNQFLEKRVSALPIVNSSGEVVDIYAKFDVINLAAERTYNNLDVTLRDALKHRLQFEGVHTCLPTESLEVIIKRIVHTQVHRLIIVNELRHILGVLSLSDLLRFILLTPHTRHSNKKSRPVL